jgi:hypothetical protein|tara:strand:+ start:37 stop:465 length:429 start_codon:yes stop_codon:yes gene_type:complete
MIELKSKSKTKKRPFDYRKKKLLSKARNQAPLVVPDIGKVRTAPAPKFRKRNQSDAIVDFVKGLTGKKKKIPGLDNKIFKSVTGDIVGTEEAFADAEIPLENYIEGYDLKKGGSIKKKMKKKKTKSKKRICLRGQGAALRGF